MEQLLIFFGGEIKVVHYPNHHGVIHLEHYNKPLSADLETSITVKEQTFITVEKQTFVLRAKVSCYDIFEQVT